MMDSTKVLLTIYLEGGTTQRVDPNNKREIIDVHKFLYIDNKGYQCYSDGKKKLKRKRNIHILQQKLIQKKVRLSEDQVNWFMNWESRPSFHEDSKNHARWMKMTPKERLYYYCSVLASEDGAVRFTVETV